jgi:hypothetical protein
MRRSLFILKRAAVAVVLGVLVATALVTAVAADQVYHSEHLVLSPVEDAPLRSGFVENSHANGPQIGAVERYVLNGASPNTSYQVTLQVYAFDPGCDGGAAPPLPIPTAVIQTNVSGNGSAKQVFVPADSAGFEGVHGIRWEVSVVGGSVAYETICTTVTID